MQLPTALCRKLWNLSREHKVSFFATLLSGWVALLGRWSGQDDVLVAVREPGGAGGELDLSVSSGVDQLAINLLVNDEVTVERLLRKIDDTLAEAKSHLPVPFAQICEVLGIDDRSLPVVSVELLGRARESSGRGGSFELSLCVVESSGRIETTVEYAPAIFDRETIVRIVEGWKLLLQGFAKHPDREVGQIGILTPQERDRALFNNNATTAPYPRASLIHELFEKQALEVPQALAVSCRDQSLTYEELDRRANQLANYLRRRGVRPRDRVGLCLERSVETVVGILGVLKSGAAYVPLDPSYPAERLAYLLDDAAPSLVLTHDALKQRLPLTSLEIVALDAQWGEVASENGRCPERGDLTSEDLAYVMYTSGSTGKPKGVMVRHRNVVNYAVYAARRFDVASGAGSMIGTSMSFDLALTGFYPPLICGRPVRLCAEDEDLSGVLLSGSDYAPVKLTPTHLGILSLPEGGIDGRVRSLVIGGELLQGSALRWWREHSPRTRIFNHYGPTETTIGCIVHEVTEDVEGPVPIGRPIDNTQIYILNAHRSPVPIGVAGEIYIGGDGVAAGYWNRPELTDERFLPDPFSSDQHARMYKTGDLGRWRSDGAIEYLGRNDDQIKIRGYRVELGEIAARISEHTQVKEAVVIAREDAPGDKRLVAYLTPHDGERPTPEELRSHLKPLLPDYMVPSAFVTLGSLPLTENGKLDKRALPKPSVEAYATQAYEPPSGEVEKTLASIWQDLLKVERVGRADNFFELGGNSLLIVQMRERLRKASLDADLRCLYDNPTLAGYAATLSNEVTGRFEVPPNLIPRDCESITPQMLPLIDLEPEHIERIVASVPGGTRNIQDIYPLAPLQEGILFHHLLHSNAADTYVFPTLLSVESTERLNDLVNALQTVINRHDILRTAIWWDGIPHPAQVVYRCVTLPVEEIELDPARGVREQLDEWMSPDRQTMDIRQAPLVRMKVAADPWGSKWYVILQVHHIVSDHESMATLLREASVLLSPSLARLAEPMQYRDHVARGIAYTKSGGAEAFFRGKLADIEEPTAPFGLIDTRGDASRVDEAVDTFDAALTQRVRDGARRVGVSPATIFHAAWALVVSHTSGRDDVVFGTVLLGRMLGATASRDVVGMFINTLPLRVALRGLNARQLIEATQRELVNLLSHEQASLSLAQRCSGVSGSAPLFSALLNYLHYSLQIGSENGAMGDGVNLLARRTWTNFPVVVSVEDRPEAFRITAQTDRRVDARRIAAYLHEAVKSLIMALEHSSATKVLKLSMLPASERRRVIEEFNATKREFPRGRLIHEIFEGWARGTPDAIAVTYEDEDLTYGEVNTCANKLAQYLMRSAVQEGDNVAIMMERSFAQVIAQIAILKCGALYVPIDPRQPADRRALMIEDCGASHVIVDDEQRDRPALSGLQWISYRTAQREAEELSHRNISSRESPRPSAYVMYTSGSTGKPKGVVVPQHAVVRLAINNGYAEISAEDRIAYCSNPAFDASTFEVWGALLNGARLVIVPQRVVLEPTQFAEVLKRNEVTILWLTIGLFAQYADALAPVFSKLRYLMTGGDVVDPAVVRRVLRNSAPLHLINAYGPTECTTFSTTYEVKTIDEAMTSIPIGRPIGNSSIYILNSEMEPVPVGAVGEIYIGGDGVAVGYLNRGELTAERFLPDPFSEVRDARLYKTGDVGRWKEDGNVEFLGRSDQQVKVRGFRIELGEIESHITSRPDVKEAVVIAREESPGHKRLLAYVVAAEEADLSAERLRDHLAAILPEYMVPSAFVQLARLPLTPNGKLDRRALPAPDCDAFVSRRYEPPTGEVEEILASVWGELLRKERIGRHDHFFDLGGHSLLAMQVTVRVRSLLSVDLAVSELFDHPVLEALAARVERRRNELMIERLSTGGVEIDELLEQVVSMSEQEVHTLMSQLRGGVRS